ncbi:MAG: hypothetical protein K2R98_09920 [Gemmataceae bacterium]|nr:hypothetical protein [Gemmataceae bacterium]
MSVTELDEIRAVVQRVQCWPPPMRIALARRILETLETASGGESSPSLPRGPSAAEVVAVFKTNKPAPSDEECRRILEEELVLKYGA